MLGSSSQQGCFFEDKKRRVDFVIIPKEKQLDPLGLYIRKLESVGLQFEVADGQTVDKKFILIHIPIRALRHFARVYNVGLEENKFSMELLKPKWYTRLFTTPISHIPRKEKGDFTSVERIIIIKKLLESTVYDADVTKKGISQLIRNNLVESAYPLHDGPIHFDPLLYTNDRQSVDKKFILIHMPYKPLKHFSKVYKIGLHERKYNLELFLSPIWYTRLFSTPISRIPHKAKGPINYNCHFLSTIAERIIIRNKLLESTVYDEDVTKKGISQLVRIILVESAYPLHDGPIHSYPLMYTNDRQSLFHHWSIITAWYKELPLDMIYRYFGSEIAFYFAWLEFYNFMLIPAAIMGSLVVIINMLLVMFYPINQIDEVCTDNDMWICPTCDFGKYCTFKKLSSFCSLAKYTYVLDNYLTLAFAIFMSFWATFFIYGWRRKEHKLKLRWDVQYQNPVLEARLEYRASAKRKKFNVITGKSEPYVPKRIRYWKVTLSVSVCLFMIFLVMVGICGTLVFKIFIKIVLDSGQIVHLRSNSTICYLVAGALANVIFVKIFSKIYGKLSIWLTDLENPRTQHDYDKSYLYKKYLLSFAINYLGFFYDAFVKGRLYTLPNRHKYPSIVERNTCQPLNCMFSICLDMGFLLMLKQFAINVVGILIPCCRSCYRKFRHKHKDPTSEIPQYEADYKLLSTNRFFITANFSDMVISYGHATFFVAAFPLAPLCVLLNNLLEVRKQADRLVNAYKRPVPKIRAGIDPWNGIMLGVTYLSTATNAFVIAFTSSFIERESYQAKNGYDLKGYVNSTLSVFATADYSIKLPEHGTPKICYFNAKRHPPDHRLKYQLTRDYWSDITWKLICILIFEHVISVSNILMSLLIPDIPRSVKEQLKLDRELAREARNKYYGEPTPKGTRK